MALDVTGLVAVGADELAGLAAGGRFAGRLFGAELTLDDRDFREARFTDCAFQAPTVRDADFSNAAFAGCRFAGGVANCLFVQSTIAKGQFFDADEKKAARSRAVKKASGVLTGC